MDDQDRQLLNLMQNDFPLVDRPFQAIGERFGVSESEVLDRVQRLRSEHILRQVSAIFDTKSIGYKSSLVAMRVDPERVNQAAQIVNEHPGVTHNYERNHEFNLWFTIAVPPTSDLEAIVWRIHELAGGISTRILYTLKLFKIGVDLDMTGSRPVDAQASPQYSEGDRVRARESTLTERDVAVIRELQEDVPAIAEPYAPMAERLGWTTAELFEAARDLQRRGFLRRVAAIMYHRKAGFRSNAMGVWHVPEAEVAEIGPKMAGFAAVSHCYQRPVYPDWPYSIFTMVHGRDDEECKAILRAIAGATGIEEYRELYSTREYKKTRLRFFTDEYADWEAKYMLAPAAI
jgi:DNA-binding Lrp family transcriptional regulator